MISFESPFFCWSLERRMEKTRRGKGFFRCRKDGIYCMVLPRKNSKNRSLKRMDGPDYRLTNFLTFLPEPKKASPHRCGRPWATKSGCGRQRLFTRPSHPVQDRWNGHGLRRPPPSVCHHITFLSAHRNEEGAHPYAHHLTPAPQPTPRHLFLHIFCNFSKPVYSLRPGRCRYAVFYSLAAVCKSCAKKGVAKETSPKA